MYDLFDIPLQQETTNRQQLALFSWLEIFRKRVAHPSQGPQRQKKSLQTTSYVNKKRYNLKHEQTRFNHGCSSFITHINSWYGSKVFFLSPYKTWRDASLKRSPRVCPCRSTVIFCLSTRQTPPSNKNLELVPALLYSFSLTL